MQQVLKHVTNRQGVQLAEFARKFGLSREEFFIFLNDEEKLKNFFQNLQAVNVWFENLKKSAEKIGARLHLVPNLVVDYSKSHNDSAMAGGPQTGSDYNVLKVGDLYKSHIENKKITETVVLLNYPKNRKNYQKTVEWGTTNGLLKTTPHVPFTVGANFPKLNYDLGPNPMYVVETTGCTFDGDARACCMWWDVAERKSSLSWQGNFGGGIGWFAFRKPRT